jgi:Flp pilus assembly protein TadB
MKKRRKSISMDLTFRNGEASALAFGLDIAGAVLERMASRFESKDAATLLQKAAAAGGKLQRALAAATLKQRIAQRKKGRK